MEILIDAGMSQYVSKHCAKSICMYSITRYSFFLVPRNCTMLGCFSSAQQLVDQLGRCHAHSHVEQEVREAVLIGQLEVVREERLQVWAWFGAKGGGDVLVWMFAQQDTFITELFVLLVYQSQQLGSSLLTLTVFHVVP